MLNLCNQNHILAVACHWNQILSNQVQCSGTQNLTSMQGGSQHKHTVKQNTQD